MACCPERTGRVLRACVWIRWHLDVCGDSCAYGDTMDVITTAQRHARLAVRHGLAAPVSSAADAADAVVALHATDPATIFLSAWARTDELSVADIEAELFDSRTLMRTLAMRRTLFVATREILPIIEVSSSVEVARKERKQLETFLTNSGIDQPATWLAAAFDEVLAALDNRAEQARAITSLVPRLATRIILGGGAHTVEAQATSRVLALMAVEGLLARGRPAGLWTGRQYVWHRRDQWLPLTDPLPDEDEAATELLRRWLDAFGPGTMTDLKWWTGWTMTKTRKALAQLDTVQVRLDDDHTGFVLADDLDPVEDPGPWVALLPSLDPTAMGWKDRHWYVGDHTAHLFDRNGNIGPTIWADGHIVGGWSQTATGDIATQLLEPVSATHRSLLDTEIDRLAAFVGDATVKPSFPTPLQKDLAAGP